MRRVVSCILTFHKSKAAAASSLICFLMRKHQNLNRKQSLHIIAVDDTETTNMEKQRRVNRSVPCVLGAPCTRFPTGFQETFYPTVNGVPFLRNGTFLGHDSSLLFSFAATPNVDSGFPFKAEELGLMSNEEVGFTRFVS